MFQNQIQHFGINILQSKFIIYFCIITYIRNILQLNIYIYIYINIYFFINSIYIYIYIYIYTYETHGCNTNNDLILKYH